MKSNKVRMNISREMHEWFSSIGGKTNDERMQKLKTYKLNSETLELLYKQRGDALLATSKMGLDYQDKLYKSRNNNRILKGLLGLSMTVSIISVSYLAYVQGWLL